MNGTGSGSARRGARKSARKSEPERVEAKSFNGSDEQLQQALSAAKADGPPFFDDDQGAPLFIMQVCLELMQSPGLKDLSKRTTLLDWLLVACRNPSNLNA